MNNMTHEVICKTHQAFQKVRFIQFCQKAYQHLDKDVTRVRQAWADFQINPLNFLANSPENLSRDILSPCR